jgi:transcriptional regulator with GAF, ATPase, and Fis domain
MSSQMISQIMSGSSMDKAPMPDEALNQASMDYRLNSLRETVLQLLGEVESLSISVPVDIKGGARLYDEVRQFEVNLIRTALGRTAGSQTRAAKLLGLKLSTLNSKIKRYQIAPALDEDQLLKSLRHESAA